MNRKPLSRRQMFSEIATQAGLTQTQVAAAFEAFGNIVRQEVGPDGPGELTVINLLKIQRVEKPAIPERHGTNNLTGKPCVFKAKPASTTVRVQPLKTLKQMVTPPKAEL